MTNTVSLNVLLSASMLCAGLFPSAGCSRSPRLGRVEGSVRLDGKPVADATITFQPSEGGLSSHGMTDAEGRFSLIYSATQPGAIVGPHTVTIETYRIALDSDGNPVEHPETVPREFNEATTLERTVKVGSQTIDFDLRTGE